MCRDLLPEIGTRVTQSQPFLLLLSSCFPSLSEEGLPVSLLIPCSKFLASTKALTFLRSSSLALFTKALLT